MLIKKEKHIWDISTINTFLCLPLLPPSANAPKSKQFPVLKNNILIATIDKQACSDES
jgi:hypothetical protein